MRAVMAELADALDSGSSGRKVVRVQIPSLAPLNMYKIDAVLKSRHKRNNEGFEFLFRTLVFSGISRSEMTKKRWDSMPPELLFGLLE